MLALVERWPRLETVGNALQTSLASPIASATRPVTLTVVSAAGWPTAPGFRFMIDTEYLIATYVNGATWIAETVDGSTAATHSGGALVTQILTAGSLNQIIADHRSARGQGADPHPQYVRRDENRLGPPGIVGLDRAMYSAADYGAVGDGVTDDTAAIQAAIDAAAAAGGGICRLVEATYIITKLYYKSDVAIVGMGEQTILSLKDGLSLGVEHSMLVPLNLLVNGASIRDLRLDHRNDIYANDTNSPCVSVDGTNRTLIENVYFYQPQTMAVWCDSSAAGQTKGLIIRGCRVTNGISGGFSFFGNLVDFQFTGNIIDGVQDDAIAVQEGTNANVGQQPTRGVIANNIIRNADVRNLINSTANGINVWGARSIVVSNNSITKTVANGILVSFAATLRSTDVTVIGNTIDQAGVTSSPTGGVPRNGIRVNASDDVTITGNSISGSQNNGIDGLSSTGLAVTGNVVRLNVAAGIGFTYVYNSTISGNIIRDNGAVTTPYGILLISDGVSPQDTAHITVTGNRITDTRIGGARTQTYGIWVAGVWTDYIIVAGNDLTGNITGAFGGVVPTNYNYDINLPVATPTAAAVAGSGNAGTSPPAPVLVAGSNDGRGSVTFGTGTTAVGTGAYVTVTFGGPFITAPKSVLITPANVATATKSIYTGTIAIGSFQVGLGVAGAVSQANTIYAFDYQVIW